MTRIPICIPLFGAVLLTLYSPFGCVPPAGGGGGGGTGDQDASGFIDSAEAITATEPADGSPSVPMQDGIQIRFIKEANPGSIDVWIEPEVDLQLSWNTGNTELSLNPTASLGVATSYEVFVGELTFADGTALADEFSFRFTTAGEGGGQPLALNEVRFWGYQIQRIDTPGAVDALAASNYDMLVIEPTRTDAELLDFDTKSMVERLKATTSSDGVHRKLVIAYVDIGEAEDWRWYWEWSKEAEDEQVPDGVILPDDWPDYIVARDPDGWVGNYPVAFWDEQWKDIVMYGEQGSTTANRNYTSLVEELVLDGFDGIYLDWVEAFEDERIIQAGEDEGLDVAQEMITFIGEIREEARLQNPDFLVIQQNAASLIDGREELVAVIDAIAQEGIWFDGPATDDWDLQEGYWETDSELVSEYIGFLDQYAAEGLPVFSCEYALDDNAEEAYSNAAAKGYVPYVTRRSLGQLTTTTPPGL